MESLDSEPKLLHECDQCQRKFLYKSSLASHYGNHKKLLKPQQTSNDLKTLHECDQCPRKFIKKSNLTLHYAIHKKLLNNKCVHCGMECSTAYQLSKHVKTHKFQCSFCPKRFTRKGYSNLHEKESHKGVTIKCSICAQEFPTKNSLEFHTKSHNPVECATEESLAVHCKMHNCELCGAEISHSSKLNCHFETHHPEMCFYNCEHCSRRFSTLDTLEEHTTLSHPEIKFEIGDECKRDLNEVNCAIGVKQEALDEAVNTFCFDSDSTTTNCLVSYEETIKFECTA